MEDIISLLRCPNSDNELVLIKDKRVIEELNKNIKNRNLVFASGKCPSEKFEAILTSSCGVFKYPVINGIPFLMKETSILNTQKGKKPDLIELSMTSAQQKQMEKFSRMHDRWYSGITEAQQRILKEYYYSRLAQSTVLDIGNGGLSVEFQLGNELATKVNRFIALDSSYSMLTRNGYRENQILADAMNIPLTSKSVDYVLVNGIIHHFGLKSGEEPHKVIGPFFNEVSRVARKGIILMELLIHEVAELIEKLALKLLGKMSTFVYSESSLLKIIKQLNLNISDVRVKWFHQLISPFSVLPPILDLEWLRVPVGFVPYKFIFFIINVNNQNR